MIVIIKKFAHFFDLKNLMSGEKRKTKKKKKKKNHRHVILINFETRRCIFF